MPSYTLSQVAQHNKPGDAWIVVDGHVLDVSVFATLHPGGTAVLLREAGTDASTKFHLFHAPRVLAKYVEKLSVGTLEGYQAKQANHALLPGSFGDLVPYGDPGWYSRMKSPYYNDSHRAWRAHVRQFVETEIRPHQHEWVGRSTPPKELALKMGAAGLYAVMLGMPYPTAYVPADTPRPTNYDYFHTLITFDEICRCGDPTLVTAMCNGPSIALSAVYHFGNEEQKRAICPDVLAGREFIALAISEPGAGSDVAGMKCTATRQGDHYVVEGNKKWITNGTYAKTFVCTLVTTPATQGKRASLSMMIIDQNTHGFTQRKIPINRSDMSGTALLVFDQCRVPAANRLGQEGDGQRMTFHNFNGERMYVSIQMLRFSRVLLEESIKYALKRHAFGKPLADQPVIRMKIAGMALAVEQYQALVETLAYNLSHMSHQEASLKLGDQICLAKAGGSKVYEYCAREATMVFGGNALHVGGVGGVVEPHVGAVKAYQIPAGAEDVMMDYAARTVFKLAKRMAKL